MKESYQRRERQANKLSRRGPRPFRLALLFPPQLSPVFELDFLETGFFCPAKGALLELAADFFLRYSGKL